MTTETPQDTERRLSNLEGQTTQIDSRLGDMNQNITRLNGDVNSRFTSLEESVSSRFTAVDARFSALENKIDSLRNIIIVASAGIIGALIATIATFVLRAS